ncbi:hypothetical protein R6Q59_023901 [Mikania micrantha]
MSTNAINSGLHICPNSGKKYYVPDVPQGSKPVVGLIFSSIDETFEFYKNNAKLAGFEPRKHTQYETKGLIKIKYFVCAKEGHKTFNQIDTVVDSLDGNKKYKDRRLIEHVNIDSKFVDTNLGEVSSILLILIPSILRSPKMIVLIPRVCRYYRLETTWD